MKSAMKLFGKCATKSRAILLPACGFALLCLTLFSPSFLGAQSSEQRDSRTASHVGWRIGR